MDEAVAFVRKYLKELDRIDRAYYSLPLDKYNREVAKFDKMFDIEGGSQMEQELPGSPDEAPEFAGPDEQPILMQLKRYEHPKYKTLYRAYLSGMRPEGAAYTDYFHNLYLQKQKDGLKIVSIYRRCGDCDARGLLNGKPCRECGGAAWKHTRGLEIGHPGKQMEVRKFEAPTKPEDRADYDSPEGLDPKPKKK